MQNLVPRRLVRRIHRGSASGGPESAPHSAAAVGDDAELAKAAGLPGMTV